MSAREIGDEHATRRLSWLFGTTIIAPSLLLGLMALGAFGHQRWSAGEVAIREVEVQLPLLAELVATHAATLSPEDRQPAALTAWVDARVMRAPDNPVRVALGATGTVPVHGPLEGQALAMKLPPDWKGTDLWWTSAGGALLLAALAMSGAIIGLSAAAREIRMSQRQTELVGRVSHELRTPLTSIGMFVDTLRAGRLPPERAEECLDLLARETDRLSRRIEELLSWARMESGARRYRRDAVPLQEVAEEAIAAFRSQILMEDSSSLALTVDIPASLPPLLGDRDAIVEALLNLLVNAWRHTEDPHEIAVFGRAEGRRVALSVRDNGPGIAIRDRRRIFEKFYRVNDADTGPRGTGLGLSIVRSIVRAHNGRVDLESTSDRGSTFTLWLPAAWAASGSPAR